MRVACVLVTHLRVKAEIRRQPRLENKPVLVVERTPGRGKAQVVDSFPGTASEAGMTLEQALSQHAGAVVLDADEPHYREVFSRMLTALQRVSDRVEGSELGIAYVRLDGLEGLYHGEAGAVSALMNSLPPHLAPRIGVADAKFPALVAARMCEPRRAFKVPDDVRAFLGPRSIDLLPVSQDVKKEMRQLGLRTMGAVASMSRHMLTDRFGISGGRAWALCNGNDDTPVVPMVSEEPIVEHISLPFPSSSIQMLFVVVDTLLKRGYARPEMKGGCVSVAALRCSAYGAPSWDRSIAFKQPAGTWERASIAVKGRVQLDPPSIPVEDVTLTLSGFTGESGVQMGLLDGAKEDGERRLVEADRRLRLRERGGYSLYKVAQVAPWHPALETRFLQMPIDPAGRDAIRPLNAPVPVQVKEGPEGRPVSVQIEGCWCTVVAIVDEWSFHLWWLPKPVDRTYYRIDASDGSRLTLFRDRSNGRWFRQRG